MPCKILKFGDTVAFVRYSKQARKKCGTCGEPSDVLCDYPVKRKGKEATCDNPCCRQHSENVGPDRDYCLAHAEHERKLFEAEEPA